VKPLTEVAVGLDTSRVIAVCRAVARHLAALADDLEQITTDAKPQRPDRTELPPDPGYVCPQCGPDPRGGAVHAEREHAL
jgi:hypothetical protein